MGSIRKRNGKFQAQVRREGVPDLSKTFTSRKDATVWVRGLEARIDAGETTVAAAKAITLADVLLRYSQEVTPHKKGREAEQRRLNRLLRDPITQVLLGKLDSMTLARFRDRRVEDGVRAAQYDLIIIRHALKLARMEWGISMPSNPVDGIRIPNGIRTRERRLMEGEYDKLQEAALSCKNAFIWPAVRFALETAVRRSELLSMSWVNTDLDRRIVMLPDTKNGTKREVPLTTAAIDIIQKLPKRCDRVFETTDYSIRHGWDRLVKRAGIKDLRFHDLRHEAVSRLFEAGLSIPEVALISGHKDYRMLARYTHLRADTLVMHPHFS